MTFYTSGFITSLKAQEYYVTRNGIIGIIIPYEGQMLNIGSNNLIVTLNYNTGDILIKLDISTLYTKIDSLDNKLPLPNYQVATFKGKLGIGYINTSKHSRQTFKTNGNLTINEITKFVSMSGVLEHTGFGPDINCLLYLCYDLPLADFNLDKTLSGFGNYANIEILQAILERENQ